MGGEQDLSVGWERRYILLLPTFEIFFFFFSCIWGEREGILYSTVYQYIQTFDFHLPSLSTTTNMTYTVVSGDTFSSIAQGLGISVAAIEAANPGVSATNLQVGQILNVPAAAPGPIGSTKYTIKSGDTFWSISQAAGITVAEIEAANPGVPATNLQVDQVINIPAKSGGEGLAPPTTISPATTNGDQAVFQVSSLPTTGEYIRYSGPASNFPDPQTWAKYELLWEQNRQLMGLHNSESEIEHIQNAIEIVSKDSGVDARVIVCVIVQESGGDVRVRTVCLFFFFYFSFPPFTDLPISSHLPISSPPPLLIHPHPANSTLQTPIHPP